jgi:alpha-mannosidase
MQLLRTRFVSGLLASVSLITLSAAQTPQKPDLTKEPTLYVVGYAHLDTEWR